MLRVGAAQTQSAQLSTEAAGSQSTERSRESPLQCDENLRCGQRFYRFIGLRPAKGFPKHLHCRRAHHERSIVLLKPLLLRMGEVSALARQHLRSQLSKELGVLDGGAIHRGGHFDAEEAARTRQVGE